MKEDLDLSYAIGLPPRRAVEYFESRGNRLSWNWEDSIGESADRSFFVAKVMRADVLQSIRQMVDKALAEGITLEQFKKSLEPALKTAGWWGYQQRENPNTGETEEVLLGSPHRLKTIYRTNLQSAYMNGRERSLLENVDDAPYWQYVAVMDLRTRPSHAVMNGRVYRYDDPIWSVIRPPRGFNCRCRIRSLTPRQIEKKGLIVESSQGQLEQQTRLVSRRSGMLEQATLFRAVDSQGREILVGPDPGWARNWEPQLDQYSPEIRAQLERALAARREAITLPTGVEIPVNRRSRYIAESYRVYDQADPDYQRDYFDVQSGGFVLRHQGHNRSDANDFVARALASQGSHVVLENERAATDSQGRQIQGRSTPDAAIDGRVFDFKQVTTRSRNAIVNKMSEAKAQNAQPVIFLDFDDPDLRSVNNSINGRLNNDRKGFFQRIILVFVTGVVRALSRQEWDDGRRF